MTRQKRVQEIVEILRSMSEKGIMPKDNDIIMELCVTFNYSERIAKEYLKIARHIIKTGDKHENNNSIQDSIS